MSSGVHTKSSTFQRALFRPSDRQKEPWGTEGGLRLTRPVFAPQTNRKGSNIDRAREPKSRLQICRANAKPPNCRRKPTADKRFRRSSGRCQAAAYSNNRRLFSQIHLVMLTPAEEVANPPPPPPTSPHPPFPSPAEPGIEEEKAPTSTQ